MAATVSLNHIMKNSTFRNPLKDNGADPWLCYYEGFYYLSTTTGNDLRMRKARHIAELAAADDVVIWSDSEPSRAFQMWAPEYFLLDTADGPRWFLYYTASDGNHEHHRMHVAESASNDPMGPYRYAGLLQTDRENAHYAIDGTLLQKADGSLYLIWAGWPGHVLFIAPMSNPWTISGERVNIPASGFGCDEVREGPVTLQRNGQIFLIYSACDTGKPDYKLGMLVADQAADLLNPMSWVQYPTPVFTRCDSHGVYGPGHNHFFQSPDGAEDWIVYHAKSSSDYTYAGRSTRAQRFTWNTDGTPNFGMPHSLDAEIPAPSGESSN